MISRFDSRLLALRSARLLRVPEHILSTGGVQRIYSGIIEFLSNHSNL